MLHSVPSPLRYDPYIHPLSPKAQAAQYFGGSPMRLADSALSSVSAMGAGRLPLTRRRVARSPRRPEEAAETMRLRIAPARRVGMAVRVTRLGRLSVPVRMPPCRVPVQVSSPVECECPCECL